MAAYAAYGFLFGLAFPIVVVLSYLWRYDLPLSWASAAAYFQQEPLHGITLTVPFVLAVAASLVGRSREKVRQLNLRLERAVADRTAELQARVDQLRRSEQALRESEAMFRNLAEESPNMIFIYCGGRVAYVNPQCEKVTGQTRAELYTSDFDFMDLIAPEFRETVRRNYERHMRGEEVEPYDYALVGRDGRIIHAIISSRLIDYQGSRAILGIVMDVTERKEAEAQRKKLREQLSRAMRMESLGLLAGGVAHDLNNILSPLVAYPEIMRLKLAAEDPLHDLIAKIEQSAGRAAEVVQDLLTMARRGRYELQPTDLNDTIRTYLQSQGHSKAQSAAPDVRLDVRLAEDLRPVHGSAPHLHKVVMHLVANALDAMPNGGELLIRTEQQELECLEGGFAVLEPGTYVILRVRDQGVGIAPDDLPHLFEPFYSTKEMGRSGSGLGLAIVYGVVKDHDGYIDVQSEPGRGTEFVIYLPAAAPSEPGAAPPSVDSDIRGDERILIVDDMAEQRELAATVLRSLGYRVDVAADGHAAVAHVQSKPVDLVVLDMIMEDDFDGLDTYREIVRVQPGQKAIIASGYSETARVKEAERLGAGMYVRKPYTMQKLGRAIRRVLAT
jgi:PAS domain S-box-containing protein